VVKFLNFSKRFLYKKIKKRLKKYLKKLLKTSKTFFASTDNVIPCFADIIATDKLHTKGLSYRKICLAFISSAVSFIFYF